VTPYELLRRTTPVQDATKSELLGLTRRLERAALRTPPPAVAATLQDQRYSPTDARGLHRARRGRAPARLHARGLRAWLAPAVVGVSLDEDDPLVDEWTVVLPGPTRSSSPRPTCGIPGCEDERPLLLLRRQPRPELVAACGRLLGI
jgi:hypothetical protein